ncbi:MAG: glycerol-3-phosphate dehydrogenase/oxidase [Deltaproteobacteria bacterium]|nr:glycerol-3-phosphate dehydrogenase/oxidase [Deltaproteobacteria bacterium]
MNRNEMIDRLEGEDFDVLVIGGGATGLGVAIDAASRGYGTALVEAWDFAKGTSGRSTKLIHGGVRYLEQMNFSLVMEALRERGILYRNAPHLVSDQSFIVPRYHWWEGPFYGIGLKLYDTMAGKLNLAPSEFLSHDETVEAIPNIEREGLTGGIRYHDGQFDDSRMAVTMALTACEHGAALANYVDVKALIKEGGYVSGAVALDKESGKSLTIKAKVVVNATGIFADTICRMDRPEAPPLIEPAQGIHLVFDRSFQPSDTAIMVPHTDDGRVLFAIPWHDRLLVGTTDTTLKECSIEPLPLDEEVDFILRNAGRYLEKEPGRRDVKSVFAGIRPLVHPPGKSLESKEISRSHEVFTSETGLVTIVGGKWTTYRKMAEDAMEHAIMVGDLPERPCVTEKLKLYGAMDRDAPELTTDDRLRVYGSEAVLIKGMELEEMELARQIHPDLPYRYSQVLWGARKEMARTVEDILSRRTRALILDAEKSIEAAPEVAGILARELGHDESWEKKQVEEYTRLARGYMLK